MSRVVVGQSGMPSLEQRPERAIERPSSSLQQQVSAARRPLHLLALGKMFADLAAKNRAALVPYLLEGVAGNPLLNLSDGIHPNAPGQKVLAENVWRVLEPLAREMATH